MYLDGMTKAIANARLRRWGDIVLYSTIGPLFALPVGFAIRHLIEAALAPTSLLPPNLIAFLLYAILLLFLGLAWCQSNTKWSHFALLFHYPPTVIAVPIGIFFLALLLFATGSKSSILLGFIALISVLLSLIAFCFAPAPKEQQKIPLSNIKVSLEKLSLEQLLDWASTESSIRDESQDFFGAKEMAQRVWEALQTERKDGSDRELQQTVVIQGPFGAGKSSIIQLLKGIAYASAGKKYIFVHVNCWGFSSIAAQEHILEQAIDELSKLVDCNAIKQMPKEYSDAISDSSSWLGAIISVFNATKSPEKQLNRFTPILRAIDSRLVIVVEDTDRNGPDFDQKHIEAMLHRFRDVERVSFVLTAGSDSKIEFPKVAECIVFLPPPPLEIVLSFLDQVRKRCLSNKSVIDPTPTEFHLKNRPESLLHEASIGQLAIYMFGFRIPDWAAAVASLINTPRKLKQTFAAIAASWNRLQGEVDVDELIMLTALRCCAPAAYSFFGIYLQDFGPLAKTPSEHLTLPDKENARKNRITYIKERWHEVVAKSDCDSDILGSILGELVWSSTKITDCPLWNAGKHCQSVNSSRGNIYWERVASDAISTSGISDQEVLKAIYAASGGDGVQSLGEKFADSNEFAELILFFENFNRRIENETLLRIASVVLQRMAPLHHYPDQAAPSLTTLKLWLHKVIPFSDSNYTDWLASEIESCLPSRLPDANWLFFNFAREKLQSDQFLKLRQYFVLSVRRHFEFMSPADFARCFEANYPYSLSQLIRIDRKVYAPECLTNFSDWIWLRNLLLEGMRLGPQVLIPQVIGAFGEFGPEGGMPTWFKFEESGLKEVFGEKIDEALQLLSQDLEIQPNTEGWFKLAWPLAIKEAKRLASNITSS